MLRIFNIHFRRSDRIYKAKLKKLLGFTPVSLALYRRAFTHMSVAETIKFSKLKNSNERLEYLGDAVLDMFIAEISYKKFPFKGEGFLTEIRSKIVSRKQLGHIAIKLGLPDFLETDQVLGHNSHIMRVLAGNALEALVGAIYLDKGAHHAKKFIVKRMLKPYIDLDDIENQHLNYKSIVNQWAQKNKKELTFEIIEEVKSIGKKKGRFIIGLFIDGAEVSRAENFSKKNAEKAASEKAVDILQLATGANEPAFLGSNYGI
ncbi:MAG: ribonuclease-3 [Bacteroidia bacterium]|jgi:ribonuclease-3